MSERRDSSVKRRVSNKNEPKSESINISSDSTKSVAPVKSGGEETEIHLRNIKSAINQSIVDPLQVTKPTAIATTSTPTVENPNDVPLAIYYLVNFQHVCIFTALLPLFTLFTCFVTAYVFQYDEVHETHCRVYNIVPSISAITGVSPQRYFWRFSIALHLGPRIPIAFIYKNYYRTMLEKMQTKMQTERLANINSMITMILTLNCIEIASLGGVTYISNRENYPIHEKIFITFMICSLCHMLATIKLNGILHEDHTELSQTQRDSIKWKKILFAMSIISTVGLLIFFAKHRFYCHDLAFSWFAFFEYLIAIANMLFHFTVIWDFPCQHMLVVQATRTKVEEIFRSSSPKMD
uniref:CWH43-like N-terminal domain-containing protein n=1 Tax=Glossina pallidipes TaxID=7398 RepID=A0A1A9ZII1_GLOPL